MNWPGFQSLNSAWLFLLVIPLLILYFLKLKRPRVEVPSLALWQQVINDQRVNSPFQKFKRNLLLLLQLLMLLALCLAAMQPFVRGGPEAYTNLPVLIDCSASMAAVDKPGGETRLDVARREVARLIDGLTGDQRLALVAVTSTARRVTDFTDNKRVLREALKNLTTTDVPGRLDEAMRMSVALARSEPIESVLVFSDGNFPQKVDFELPFAVNYQQISAGGTNIGITEFNARRSEADAWDVFVRVAARTGTPAGGTLTLLQDGTPIAEETVVLEPGESQRFSFRVSAPSESTLEATVQPDAFDSLPGDNQAWLHLPEGRPLRVYAHPQLAAWRHALRGIRDIEVYPLPDDASEPAGYDVVISDSAEDLQREAMVRVFTGILPTDLADFMEPQENETRLVDWDRTEAALQHVQLADITVLDAPVRREGVVDNQIEELGYQILAWGQRGPLLLKRRDGMRVTYFFLFHTDKSTLPYRLAFPITVANLVREGFRASDLSELRAQRTGVLAELRVQPDRSYTIQAPDGSSRTIQVGADGVLSGIPAPHSGLYRISEGGQLLRAVGAGLLSPLESSLQAIDKIEFREIAVTAADSMVKNDRPLWKYLALAAFAILLVEWWYFQRRPLPES